MPILPLPAAYSGVRIHLDFPPVVGVEQLADLLNISPATLLANRSRAPWRLPPACMPDGSKKPVWLLADVLEWLAAHREAAPVAVAKAPPPPRRPGRPSKIEQDEARRQSVSVRELRALRHEGKGGAA